MISRESPTGDAAGLGELAETMLPLARELASRIRSRSPEAIGTRLDAMCRQELYGLVTVALAMVDVDRPLPELLGWFYPGLEIAGDETPGPSRVLAPCGTDSAYKRHLRRNEPTCRLCRDAHTAAEVGRAERAREAAAARGVAA